MAISPYIRALRARVGHERLVLPSAAVLPVDELGRLLLVENAETGEWQTLGGAIEPDESPRDAAVREALEEAGVNVELTSLLDVLGGPEFLVTYPNGDAVSYVVAVYRARVVSGTPTPDGEETSAVGWWSSDELTTIPLSTLTRELLDAVRGQLRS